MIRAALLLSLLPGTALAQDMIAVPSTSDLRGPLTITLAPSEVYDAEVRFQNELVYVWLMSPGPYILTLDGLTVAVDLDQGPGDEPDTLTVLPPAGYVAIPPEIVVDEGQVGVVVIQQFLGM